MGYKMWVLAKSIGYVLGLTLGAKKKLNAVICNIVEHDGPFKHHMSFSNEEEGSKKIILVLYCGQGVKDRHVTNLLVYLKELNFE